jgi:outer membrane receptor for ferrienterochelin and colicins
MNSALTRNLLVGLGLSALVLSPVRAFAQDSEAPPPTEEISLDTLVDIVVTATLREQSTLDAPASIQVVNASEIRSRGYRNIKQVMNDVPGFNDVSDTNEEIVSVRGVFTSTTNKVLFLVNGHRMNDLMLGRYNADQFLGMESVERIEFIRGPASALYGSGALVGIVNIITKRGADFNGAQGKIQGGRYGQEASATWGRQIVGYDVFFNFTYLNALGQTIAQPAEYDVAPTGGTAQGGDVYLGRYRENMSGLLTLRSETSSLALRAAHFRRVPPRGSNGSFFNYDQELFKPSYTENDFMVDYQYHLNFGADAKNKITINPSAHFFSYYEQSFITFGANDAPPIGQRSGMIGEFTDYQLKVTYERQLLDSLNLITGVDGLLASFHRSDAWSIGAGSSTVTVVPSGYTQPGKWFLGGGFVQAVANPYKPLTLTVGARFDTFQNEAKSQLTPRLGLVYKPTDQLAVKALYGRSYLAPMWAHKRANDGNFQGNPNLKPETFEGVDFIVAYGSKKASASVDAFYNDVNGLINSVRQIDPATNMLGSKYQYLNSANSRYMGVEAAGDVQTTKWLRLLGSYSHIRPDTNPDQTSASLLVGESIKDIPHHTIRYGLRLDPTSKLSFSAWGRAYLETKTADPITMESSIPAVALFDASLMYNWQQFTFQVIGTNLTNRYYERGGAVARPLARERLNIEGAVTAKF